MIRHASSPGMIRFTQSQAGRLLAMISEINGRPAITSALIFNEETPILVEVDGLPKVYLIRRRSSYEATCHGYAAHGRDKLALDYLLLTIKSSPRRPRKADPVDWKVWAQDVRDLAKTGRLDRSPGRLIKILDQRAKLFINGGTS